MDDEHKHMHIIAGENSTKEYAKFALVIAVIILLSYILNATLGRGDLNGYLRWFMGVFFVVFASFKLIGYRMFVMMFAGYDVAAKRVKAYAYLYPFIELGLGILYMTDALPVTRDIVTILIMVVGSIGVVQEIRRRSGIHCACLGNVIKLPLSTVSLIEDVGMGLMAVVMLLFALQ